MKDGDHQAALMMAELRKRWATPAGLRQHRAFGDPAAVRRAVGSGAVEELRAQIGVSAPINNLR